MMFLLNGAIDYIQHVYLHRSFVQIDNKNSVVLCRLIYPGVCIHANIFNHYHRIKMLWQLTKLSEERSSRILHKISEHNRQWHKVDDGRGGTPGSRSWGYGKEGGAMPGIPSHFVSDQRRWYYTYKSVQEGNPHRPVFRTSIAITPWNTNEV